jgi:hypothetical protein
MLNMINMLSKVSNIYVILIIIAVIIYTFFFKAQVYESFFKGRNRFAKIFQNSILKKNKYHCQSYINRYPDLQRAFGKSCRNRNTKIKARDHYLKYGLREKRNPRRPPQATRTGAAGATAASAAAAASPAVATAGPVPEPISEQCKRHTDKTKRRIVEANNEIEKARYRMEAAFRSCNRIL